MRPEEEALLGYVRGDASLTALRLDALEVAESGVELRGTVDSTAGQRSAALTTYDGRRYMVRYDPDLTIEPLPKDVALGFLHRRQDVSELQEWAFLMLALPVVDASRLQTPEGEVLLSALHAASFGESPRAELWALAGSLAENTGREPPAT